MQQRHPPSKEHQPTRGMDVYELLKRAELESILSLDLRRVAEAIESRYEDKLLPPPEGLYIPSKLEPVVCKGDELYNLHEVVDGKIRTQKLQLVIDLEKNTLPLYNKRGVLLVSQKYVDSPGVLLTSTPHIPYRGTKIAEFLITRALDNFVAWQRRNPNPERLLEHFRDDAFSDPEETYKALDDLHYSVNSELYDWLGDKMWNIYTVTRDAMTVRVSRYTDYRIMDWTLRYENGEITL